MTRTDIQVLIDAIGNGQPNTALEVRTVLNAIADGSAITGDVKEVDVPTSYIVANFDATGLGTNERLGWAICNGNNGTRNRNGRVPLQYDPANPLFSTLGTPGGSANSVVVAHFHTVNQILGYGPTAGKDGFYDRSQGESPYGITTESTGESGTNKNYQPYIVTLFIQKL
jgi:hypothetical protein